MIGQLQVTIGAAATRFTATNTPVCYARIEADDGNGNPAFIGGSSVTTANGQRLNNSATLPEELVIGPFPQNYFDLSELYAAGTQGEIVNILYVTH